MQTFCIIALPGESRKYSDYGRFQPFPWWTLGAQFPTANDYADLFFFLVNTSTVILFPQIVSLLLLQKRVNERRNVFVNVTKAYCCLSDSKTVTCFPGPGVVRSWSTTGDSHDMIVSAIASIDRGDYSREHC